MYYTWQTETVVADIRSTTVLQQFRVNSNLQQLVTPSMSIVCTELLHHVRESFMFVVAKDR